MATCGNCSTPLEKVLSCSRCKSISYCGKSCQTSHWTIHKTECGQKFSQSYTALHDHELVSAQDRFKAVVAKYNLADDADLLADIICGGVVTPQDICQKVGKGMTEVDAKDLLRWISIGVEFKEKALDPNARQM